MIFRDRAHNRGVELGPYPLEVLPRDPGLIAKEASQAQQPSARLKQTNTALAEVARRYAQIIAASESSNVAPRAPVPDDLERRAKEIKGAAYYLDASHVGICTLPESAEADQHSHAIISWVRYGLQPESDNLAHQWLDGAAHDIAIMRALEIGVSITGHIRALGFTATLHHGEVSTLDLNQLAVLAGVGQRRDGAVASPFFGTEYAGIAITTSYALATDLPLAADAKPNLLSFWWGINGAVSGREHRRAAKRATHLSRYPMEQVQRVDRPTTLILDDEVPRVPKRAEFFFRSRMGDLGPKAQREVQRFAFKHPLTDGMMKPLRALVPHQDGTTADEANPELTDPAANSRAIKSLSYHLGADLTGICEIPRYAWYSHGPDGQPIEMRHKYAVVMLIDQGYDTMEGASGDDWISGCQSMRGYIRGAEIAGVMAEFLRGQGYDSRPQTNADSEVLQIPLVLWAGLGELSRIGELVLNPFVGPRFKSVVLTTDLPLEVDKPIDFGLQTFCGNCLKCARECPCDAIPFGDKVMFNGYEMWKPDVERCTRYRLTNVKGSACGRCMKTCPINKVIDADGAILTRLASWLGVNAMWLKPVMVPLATRIDDWLGNGRRNAAKKWWLDLELVEGAAVTPPKGTNRRDLDPSRVVDPASQKMAYYPADAMPAPDREAAVPLDRKAALAAKDLLETPDQARRRQAAGAAPPKHYQPTPPEGVDSDQPRKIANPYR